MRCAVVATVREPHLGAVGGGVEARCERGREPGHEQLLVQQRAQLGALLGVEQGNLRRLGAMQFGIQAAVEQERASQLHLQSALLAPREQLLCDRYRVVVGEERCRADALVLPQRLDEIGLLVQRIGVLEGLLRGAEAEEVGHQQCVALGQRSGNARPVVRGAGEAVQQRQLLDRRPCVARTRGARCRIARARRARPVPTRPRRCSPAHYLRMGDHARMIPASGAESRGSRAREEIKAFTRRIVALGIVLVSLLALGALVLALSEGVSFWYGFRWALDTASTEGNLPTPHTLTGQIAQMVLIVVGVGTLFYALATVTELFVAGHLFELLSARRSQKMIDSLRDHHIVCGFGRVGSQVARDLHQAGANVVVIDASADMREVAEQEGVNFIEGDATDDDVLVRAGIAHASSIVACADSDANNVFITLTARELRSDIRIVARAAIEDTEKKLKRAGADRVISPYKASGTEMARLALHRQLSGVVDVDAEYRMEEIVVEAGCEAIGRTIGGVRGDSMIVGLRRGAQFQAQPAAETTLLGADVLVAMGSASALTRLEGLLEAGAHGDRAASI